MQAILWKATKATYKMDRNFDIKNELLKYTPYNDQEKSDIANILSYLDKEENLYTRENKAYHFTASALVTNQSHDKVLMVYHNIYNSWSWLGGHADGEKNLLNTAIREVREESGISKVVPVSDDIFSVEIIPVEGHLKKGKYISSHLHLNVTFLLQADDTQKISVKEDENSAVGWFSLEDAIDASTEDWFKKRIYPKLNKKLQSFFIL